MLRRVRHVADPRVPDGCPEASCATRFRHRRRRRRACRLSPACRRLRHRRSTGAATPLCRSCSRSRSDSSGCPDGDFFLPAKAHRAARIEIGEVENRKAEFLRGCRTVRCRARRRGLPVHGAAGSGRHERARQRSRPYRDRRCGAPNLFRPSPSSCDVPYLLVTRCSPVTRSSTKK